VHPLWETWAELVCPDCDDVIAVMESNRDWYSSSVPFSPTAHCNSAAASAENGSSSPGCDRFTFEPTNTATCTS